MRVQPLHSAAALGDVEACRLLIAAGADVNARQAGEHTPLHEAALTGSSALVELLLAAGADTAATNSDGSNARAFATANGHAAIAGRIEESERSDSSNT
jgi:ankyrin repeat protein